MFSYKNGYFQSKYVDLKIFEDEKVFVHSFDIIKKINIDMYINRLYKYNRTGICYALSYAHDVSSSKKYFSVTSYAIRCW